LLRQIVIAREKFASAIKTVDGAADAVIQASKAYYEFSKSDDVHRAKLLALEPVNERRLELLTNFERKYGVPVEQEFSVLLDSAEEIKMKEVLRAEARMSERIHELRSSAADADVLGPIMDFYNRA
jgi:DNA repair ATPase RecN